MNIPLRQYYQLLVRYLRAQRREMALLAVLLSVGISLQLLNPQLIRYVIDTALSKSPLESVTAAAALFFALAFLQQVTAVLTTFVGQTIAWTATNELRHDLAKHALTLDQSYHNIHVPGEMIERIDGDVTILSNFFSQFTIQLVGNGLLLTGILLLFFLSNWPIGIALGGYAGLALFVFSRIRNFGAPLWKALRGAYGDLYGFIEERLAGTQDIRSSGATEYIMHRFYMLARQILRLQLRASLAQNLSVNGAFLLFAVGSAVAFAISAYLFKRGQLTIGTAYVIFYYTTLMNRPMDMITQQLADLQQASAGIARISDLMAIQPQISEGSNDYLPHGPLPIEFDGVTFGYEAEDSILENFDLHIEAGQTLGVLGRTGSGKTTIARLALRLYDPQSGNIRVNGVDLRDLRFATLRQHLSMVTQSVQLFRATVRENLTLFDATIDDRQIMIAIRNLGLVNWLNTLDKGLDTELSAGGGNLSAGEAQLLAFARVFLKNPGLVILDEASSRLDPATENRIEQAIDGLAQDRTLIIIAHRLATVYRADKILILEKGHVIEFGDRVALMNDPGSKFHHLLHTSLEEVLT